MAFGSPLSRISKVSIRSTLLSGYISAYALNDSYSDGKNSTQLCAMVPESGMSKCWPQIVQDVPATPAI